MAAEKLQIPLTQNFEMTRFLHIAIFSATVGFLSILTAMHVQAQEFTRSPQPTKKDIALAAAFAQLDIPCCMLTTQDSVELPYRMQSAPEGYCGRTAMDNVYVPSRLVIVQRGDTLYDSGEYVADVSGVRAKIRGNMSANSEYSLPSVKIKLSKKYDLLFRGDDELRDKEWLLLNYLSSYNFTCLTGHILGNLAFGSWQPAMRYATFVINGVPRGIFLLSESIKAAEHRVDIAPDGFLIENDAYAWSVPDEPQFSSILLPYFFSFTYKYPNPDDVTPGLNDEIAAFVQEAEQALTQGEDVSTYFDLASFATWLVCQDILGSIDPAGTNMYVKRETCQAGGTKSSLLQAGPIWDFDGCMHPGYIDNEWAHIHDRNSGFFWIKEMMKRPEFVDAYGECWERIRPQVYNVVTDSLSRLIERDGPSIDRAFSLIHRYETGERLLANVRSWLEMRLEWMDVAVKEMLEPDYLPGMTDEREYITQIYSMQGILLRTEQAPRDTWWHTLSPGCYIVRTIYPSGVPTRVEKAFVKGR